MTHSFDFKHTHCHYNGIFSNNVKFFISFSQQLLVVLRESDYKCNTEHLCSSPNPVLTDAVLYFSSFFFLTHVNMPCLIQDVFLHQPLCNACFNDICLLVLLLSMSRVYCHVCPYNYAYPKSVIICFQCCYI